MFNKKLTTELTEEIKEFLLPNGFKLESDTPYNESYDGLNFIGKDLSDTQRYIIKVLILEETELEKDLDTINSEVIFSFKVAGYNQRLQFVQWNGSYSFDRIYSSFHTNSYRFL